MPIGHRIQNRLTQLGMSQAELARRVSVDQSTINGLIRGHSRSSKHLHLIARELGTTAAYLTGETDDVTSDAPTFMLNHEERQWIEYLHLLGEPERKSFLTIMKSLIEGASKSNTLHNDRRAYQAEV